MIDENYFVSEIVKGIKNLNEKVIKCRGIAEVAKPDVQIEHYQVIEDMVVKEHAVIEKLAVFDGNFAIDLNIFKNENEKIFITLCNRLALSRSTQFENMFHAVSF